MKTEYKKVKLKKKVILFVLGISSVAWILFSFGRQWASLPIPFLVSVMCFFFIKNDRILYNDSKVILFFPPLGKKVCLSWDQIENVEVKYKPKLGRGRTDYNWYMIITYTLKSGKAETMEKLYYDYDGAGDFEDTYKRINKIIL